MKILVVDDNPDNLELVSDILGATRHELIMARDGLTALEKAQAIVPDLILLDVNMPNMNGFEVLERLKAQPALASIPVIMLTAISDVDSRVRGFGMGADDYLPKPFSPRELLARVDRSLRAKSTADELRVQEQRVRNTFERFVAPSIVEQLLQNPSANRLGGDLQTVTVLFADLEGFTALSERTDPETLLRLLNSYHTFMVRIINRYEGTVDKFIGDGIMVLYNTPQPQEDHVARAVKTALHIQDEIFWFHEKLPLEHRLKVNFGIHSGLAVVGNVGTDHLMNRTAVGDTVNIASRLQSIADRGRILVSELVYMKTERFVFGRSRGPLYVKGRSEPVLTYEISNTWIEE
ncbi:MAG: response regulator [Anaerolineae bacterium]|nr:response regulator [Anaerolineae bacterium]MDW8172808.1 adenylate/guanylate cyclase domain-containing protein [Anaerolineae bacterium]